MPTPTGWLLIITGAIWFVWEMVSLATGIPTISQEFWGINDKATSVGFLMGLLMGHFFWPRRK